MYFLYTFAYYKSTRGYSLQKSMTSGVIVAPVMFHIEHKEQKIIVIKKKLH